MRFFTRISRYNLSLIVKVLPPHPSFAYSYHRSPTRTTPPPRTKPTAPLGAGQHTLKDPRTQTPRVRHIARHSHIHFITHNQRRARIFRPRPTHVYYSTFAYLFVHHTSVSSLPEPHPCPFEKLSDLSGDQSLINHIQQSAMLWGVSTEVSTQDFAQGRRDLVPIWSESVCCHLHSSPGRHQKGASRCQ